MAFLDCQCYLRPKRFCFESIQRESNIERKFIGKICPKLNIVSCGNLIFRESLGVYLSFLRVFCGRRYCACACKFGRMGVCGGGGVCVSVCLCVRVGVCMCVSVCLGVYVCVFVCVWACVKINLFYSFVNTYVESFLIF